MSAPASCTPAPYGKACVSCARSKCKCYTMSNGSGKCERCFRLGKTCEPSTTVRRKRKVNPNPLVPRDRNPPVSDTSDPSASRLEKKLDDLVSLLQAQGVAIETSPSTSGGGGGGGCGGAAAPTPPSSSSTCSSTSLGPSKSSPPRPLAAIAACHVDIPRPAAGLEDSQSLRLVHEDVSRHQIWAEEAEERLATFRRCFLTHLPFVHIPHMVTAADLRSERPFLWLTIMTLTSKSVAAQFAMEETIWSILSRRVVAQKLVSLDLLLGLLCFASWSHYFKQDTPFMTMLSQLAVSMALELNLHRESRSNVSWRGRFGRACFEQAQRQSPRTLEQRRTMLSVWYLTSCSWACYHKAEPLPWSQYLSSCTRILHEAEETYLDAILIIQVKAHLISNRVTCPSYDDGLFGEEDGPSAPPSSVLTKALLHQLSEIRQTLPSHIHSHRTAQLAILNAELTVRATCLDAPAPGTRTESPQSPSNSRIRRLQDLEAVLSAAERWQAAYFDSLGCPLPCWIGVNVDVFSQFTQCLVIAFRLTMLNVDGREPGWDAEQVRRRVDVLDMLDRTQEIVAQVPAAVGIVDDTSGPRKGIWQKTPHMFRAIKTLLLAEMPSDMVVGWDVEAAKAAAQQAPPLQQLVIQTPGSMEQGADELSSMFTDGYLPEELMTGMIDAPWLSELWGPGFDSGGQSLSFDMAMGNYPFPEQT